jgi:hypothetical protein
MNESTQWLSDAAVAPALPALLSGLVRQLRVYLNSGWPAFDRLAAIREELDGLAPPPPPDPDTGGPVYGRDLIGQLLATSTSPATMLFSAIAGAPVSFAVWTDGCVQLTGEQCKSLDAEPGTWAEHRRGTFKLDGRVLADVTSDVITSRMPSAAVARLEAGTPLGAVLAAIGRREPLSVLPWGGGLVSSARMWTTGHGGRRPERVALAEETVHPWFCQRVPDPDVLLQRTGGAEETQVAEQVHDRLVAGQPEPAAAGVQV